MSSYEIRRLDRNIVIIGEQASGWGKFHTFGDIIDGDKAEEYTEYFSLRNTIVGSVRGRGEIFYLDC